MDYKYCHRWDTESRTTIDPISEEEAKRRFRGEVAEPDHWFSGVASKHPGVEGAAPEYVLEVLPRASYVNVNFLDPSCDQRYSYGFTRMDDSLFMSHVTEHRYPGRPQHYGLDEALYVAQYLYKPDGYTKEVVMDDSDPTTHVSEYRDVDVSRHWEPVPEFGVWESLGQFKRW
jgi:hypothetical protein